MRFTAAGVALLIALPAAAQVQLTVRGDGKKIISNAGENAVFKYAGIPPYDETMTYVKRALTVYYGTPYGQATWFPAGRGQRKLGGGFRSELLQPVAATAGMRDLGTH